MANETYYISFLETSEELVVCTTLRLFNNPELVVKNNDVRTIRAEWRGATRRLISQTLN